MVRAGERSVPTQARQTSGITTALIVRYVRDQGGDDAVRRMLAMAGDLPPLDQLENERSWTTYDQKIALFEAASEVCQDPLVALHIGETVLEHRVGVGLKLLLRTLGSPRAVLKNVAKTAPKFSTVCTMEAPAVRRRRATITYRLHEGFTPHPMDCDYNVGLLSQVSVLFGLPPAEVDHPECQVRGAPRCVYHLRWASRSQLRRDESGLAALLRDQLDWVTRRAEALQSAAAELVSSEDVTSVLEAITARASEAVQGQAFLLAVRPTERDDLRIHYEGLSEGDAHELARRLSADRSSLGSGAIVASVKSTHRNYGHLAALSPEGGSFFPQEQRLLAAFARQAAAALDSATAVERALAQEQAAAALVELSRSLARATSKDDIVQRVSAAAPRVTGAPRCVVFLRDEETGSFEVRAVAGYRPESRPRLLGLTVDFEGVAEAERALSRSEPRALPLDPSRGGPLAELAGVTGPTTLIVVPIGTRDQVFGMIAVGTRDGEDLVLDLELRKKLLGLADQGASTLQSLSLLETERAAADALREADRVKSEFLAMVSHELRTPLAAILGMGKTLSQRRGDLDESTAQEFVAAIIQRGEQLKRLVDDLLLSTADIELHAAPVNERDLVESAVADARRTERGARISSSVPERLWVVADGGRIRQVVDNLVANSLKHAPGANIEVRAERSDHSAWISVSDDGPGMRPREAEHAFEPFYQADSSDNRPSGGAGLGLYICKRIVEASGGEITLKSAPGAGTEVRFSIPIT